MNIAARAGAWSAGQTVGTRMPTNAEEAQGGSARAEAILARAGIGEVSPCRPRRTSSRPEAGDPVELLI